MSIPNFRLLQKKNVYLYSTCVFWFLDNAYAQSFLYNFSNYGIEDIEDHLKEVALGEVFQDTNIHRDQAFFEAKIRVRAKGMFHNVENDVGLGRS